ncbi:MAG: exonuclease domain-containing protein [Chitinophagales bacterium]
MYAIVDIETTGTNSGYNSITEVAIYIHDGEKIVDQWQSLINPQTEIPPFIIQMTGITNEMVAVAPLFSDLAQEIHSLLHDKIFVAHNAGFDYGFLKSHLAENGYELQTKKLCTVRLSRKIFPGHRSYSLGRLSDTLGIVVENRHRAAGDAFATAKIFTMLLQNDKDKHIETALKRIGKEQHLPPNMDKAELEALPISCGVYYFHDAYGRVIYVGKAKNIKSRVYGHFTYADYHGKENDLRNSVYSITYELTGNELIALLLESEQIKRKFPKFNNAQKLWDRNYCIFKYTDQKGYIHLAIERFNIKKEVLKVFPDFLSARDYLNSTMHTHQLCAKYCHLQKVLKTCYNYDLGICHGACIDKESTDDYNARVSEAIQSFRNESHTYFIIGEGRNNDESSVIFIEKGHYLGYGFYSNDYYNGDPELLKETIKWRPDTPDVQRILTGWISRYKDRAGIKIIPLTENIPIGSRQ